MNTTWQKGMEIPLKNKLSGDMTTEVVIVGGGITGITTAYLLAKAGKQVIVIEKESLKESTTAYTTAFIASDIDTDASDLVKIYGKEKAKKIWQTGAHAADSIEEIIKKEKIDCEFTRCSEYTYATSKDGHKALEKEAKLAESFGFSMKALKKTDLPFKYESAYELENQAKFHPLKYLVALREKAESYGAVFFEKTEAKKITREGEKAIITTKLGTLTADFVIVATYLSIKNPPTIFGRKGMYVSYVYELEIKHGAIPEGLYLDDMNPYHYIRVDKHSSHDRMIIGGEDHRKELPISEEKNFKALRKYLKDHFPDLEYKIVTKWTGNILETLDGLPYIGRPSKKHPELLVATGFSGNGMTYSMIAAQILSDMIIGNNNLFAKIYDPYRSVNGQGLWTKTLDYGQEFFGGYMKNIFK